MEGIALWFANKAGLDIEIGRNQLIDVASEGERQGVGDRVVRPDQMSFHVRAAIHPRSTPSWSAVQGILIISNIVVVHQLVIPGIGLEIFVTVGDVPGSLGAGFAESDAAPDSLVLVVILSHTGIDDVFARSEEHT